MNCCHLPDFYFYCLDRRKMPNFMMGYIAYKDRAKLISIINSSSLESHLKAHAGIQKAR